MSCYSGVTLVAEPANSALARTARSHALAAVAHRGRSTSAGETDELMD